LISRKKKYHFNRATLVFEEIRPDRKKKLTEFFTYISLSLIVTLMSGYLLNIAFGSPESRFLEKKVISLNEDLRHLFDKGRHFSLVLRKDHFPKDNTYRTILQIDTLPFSLRDAGTGGSASDAALSLNNDLSHELDDLISKLNMQLKIQTGSYETLYEKAREHAVELTHLPAIQPIARKDLIMISSNFGMRSDPFLNTQEVHSGLDFEAPEGKNVYATGDGTVTLVQFSRTGYGNEIVIDHAFGFGSRYAHLKEILVTEGQKIKRGELIGKVGQSGRATGPHLHYEVLYENKPVNPAFYFDNTLTMAEYQQILKQATDKTN
jgi:murein DD-endopeptidase MepM/ murein hydrolase activator NlpD